jgi:hypothetical protein
MRFAFRITKGRTKIRNHKTFKYYFSIATMVKRTRRIVTLQLHCLSCSIPAINPTHIIVLNLVILIKFHKEWVRKYCPVHCKISICILTGNTFLHFPSPKSCLTIINKCFLTTGRFYASSSTRNEGRTLLGIRHILVFIQCSQAPFTFSLYFVFPLFATHTGTM